MLYPVMRAVFLGQAPLMILLVLFVECLVELSVLDRGGSRQKDVILKPIMTDMPCPFPGNAQEIDVSVLGVY